MIIDINLDGTDLPAEDERQRLAEAYREMRFSAWDEEEKFVLQMISFITGDSNSFHCNYNGDIDDLIDDMPYEFPLPPIKEWDFIEERLLLLLRHEELWENGCSQKLFRSIERTPTFDDSFTRLAALLQTWGISIENTIRLGAQHWGKTLVVDEKQTSYAQFIMAHDEEFETIWREHSQRWEALDALIDLYLKEKPELINPYIDELVPRSFAGSSVEPRYGVIEKLCDIDPTYKETLFSLFESAYETPAEVYSRALESIWDLFPEETERTFPFAEKALSLYLKAMNEGSLQYISFPGDDEDFFIALFEKFGDRIYPAVEYYFLNNNRYQPDVLKVIFEQMGERAMPIMARFLDATISEKYEYGFFLWHFDLFRELKIDLNPIVGDFKPRFNGSRAIAQIFASQLAKCCDHDALRAMAEGTKHEDLLITKL